MGRARYASTPDAGPPAAAYLRQYDYDGDNLTYEGWAAPGTATSDALWAIRKLTYSGTNLVTEQWADGDTDEDNVWDNRAALTYL